MHAQKLSEVRDGHRSDQVKAAQRAMWALGDYHRIATELFWDLGATLVQACGIGMGQRVLDVAAGSGNVALQAAETGARVVASDLTPEIFEGGRRAARLAGVDVEWLEADAEALPFADDEFDVVTSSVGAMFAPDQQAVADELVRVCRPGGTIGMINLTPEGHAGTLFAILGRFGPPPPPEAPSPLDWGRPDRVAELFGDRVSRLTTTRGELVERFAGGPSDYIDFYKTTFGPVVAIYTLLADQPERAAALDRALLDFAKAIRSEGPGGASEYHYEYLLMIARKRRR